MRRLPVAPRSMLGPARPDAEDKGMCLTMHQPLATLLVAGFKRAEGRSWPHPCAAGRGNATCCLGFVY